MDSPVISIIRQLTAYWESTSETGALRMHMNIPIIMAAVLNAGLTVLSFLKIFIYSTIGQKLCQ